MRAEYFSCSLDQCLGTVSFDPGSNPSFGLV
jgi:hypothetical protein